MESMETTTPTAHSDGVKRRIAYFYDAEIGNYHYGQGHPMKVSPSPFSIMHCHIPYLTAYALLCSLYTAAQSPHDTQSRGQLRPLQKDGGLSPETHPTLRHDAVSFGRLY